MEQGTEGLFSSGPHHRLAVVIRSKSSLSLVNYYIGRMVWMLKMAWLCARCLAGC
jgi:hypothetical protein